MTARKPTPPNLPRRFYKEAAVSREGDRWAILLDGKPVRTPQKNHLATEHETLATLIAEEWAAQGDLIDPTTMPLTRLLNVSIDGAPGARDALADEVAKYATIFLTDNCSMGKSGINPD
jgi:chaperone required for assembly of F1-ATPase